MPAAEGLCCGVRPILFDAPHYRTWYDGLAEFIPETDREQIIKDLTSLFKKPIREVTPNEIEDARARFDWEKIVTNFWKLCL
jgi:glycosyltransferase involved in cell wall biosynthesis